MEARAKLLKQISEAWHQKWTSADKITIYTIATTLAKSHPDPEALLRSGEPCLRTLQSLITHVMEFCTEHLDTFRVLLTPFLISGLPDCVLMPATKPPVMVMPEAGDAWSVNLEEEDDQVEEEMVNHRKRALVPEQPEQQSDQDKRPKITKRGKRRADDDGGGNLQKQRRLPKEVSRKISSSALTCLEDLYGPSGSGDDDNSPSSAHRGITI